MSRFNKNGMNLSPEEAEKMVERDLAPTTPAAEDEKKVESPANADDAASTQEPIKGTEEETKEQGGDDEAVAEAKRRRFLRKNKKGE